MHSPRSSWEQEFSQEVHTTVQILRFSGAQDSVTYAFVQCMYATMSINVGTLVNYAKSAAANGQIDPLSNLNSDKVFLYSGTGDTVVNPAVMQSLESFYSNFITNGKCNESKRQSRACNF